MNYPELDKLIETLRARPNQGIACRLRFAGVDITGDIAEDIAGEEIALWSRVSADRQTAFLEL